MRTDTILSTDLPVDSAILGVTFYVYVDGEIVVCDRFLNILQCFVLILTFFQNIPVGHYGRDVENVFMDLLREGQTNEAKRFVLAQDTNSADSVCFFYFCLHSDPLDSFSFPLGPCMFLLFRRRGIV